MASTSICMHGNVHTISGCVGISTREVESPRNPVHSIPLERMHLGRGEYILAETCGALVSG